MIFLCTKFLTTLLKFFTIVFFLRIVPNTLPSIPTSLIFLHEEGKGCILFKCYVFNKAFSIIFFIKNYVFVQNWTRA